MKKILTLTTTVFIAFNLFSQIEKGKLLISIDGDYTKTGKSTGTYSNIQYTQGKYLELGASASYFLTDRWIAGFGLDYLREKEERSSSLFINSSVLHETTTLKNNILLPNAFIGYFYPITSKLYFNVNARISYGKLKTKYNGQSVNVSDFIGDTFNNERVQIPVNGNRSYNQSDKQDYFGIDIASELTYFITPKFGLYLGLGGISYSLLDWETDNSSCMVSFKPSNWNFGVRYRI
nr:hypothetical protein [uncultured Carboxylicivirga sp.]